MHSMVKALERGIGLLLSLALVSCVLAVPDITENDIRNHIQYLASDELEGRLGVSRGYDLASEYAAKHFSKYGLEPKGSQGFFQPFEATAGVRPGKNNFLTINIAGERFDFELDKNFMPVNGGRFNHWAEGPLTYVGLGRSDEEHNDFLGVDPEGKVLLMLIGKDSLATPSGIRSRVQNAAKMGAVGVIFISDEQRVPAPLPGGGARNPQESIPVVEVTASAIQRIDSELAAVLREPESDAQGRALAFDIAKSRARFVTQVVPNRGEARNVIGFLPGNHPTLKDEIIVIGGHLDHIGFGQVGTTGRSREIHNGADDNASGSAAVLELAEYYSHYKTNQRSMLFILFGAEEVGLIGSRYFVDNPTVDLSKVTAMLNFDMVGRLRDDRLVVTGTGTSLVWPELLDGADKQGLTVRYSPGVGGGSDHASFARKQVPVLFFFTGVHPDYHRPTDEWHKINYPGQVKVLEYARRVIDAIDSRAERIPWQQPSSAREERQDRGPRGDGPRTNVRVGLVPDYSFDGPGIRLAGTTPGTPAEKAGLLEGDIILMWDDIEIANMEDLMRGFAAARPGVTVKLTIQRGDTRLVVALEPEPR